jgi:putative membrane protein insertion efficiency factor
MSTLVIGLLKAYQTTLSFDHGWLGKLLPGHQVCRYTPTCSEYAVQSVERFGIVKGLMLAVRRVGRCHPWGGWGYDPVPEK